MTENEFEENLNSMRLAYRHFLDSILIKNNPFKQSNEELENQINARNAVHKDALQILDNVDHYCRYYRIIDFQESGTEKFVIIKYPDSKNRVAISYKNFIFPYQAYIEPSATGNRRLIKEVLSTFNDRSGDIAISDIEKELGQEILLNYAFHACNNWQTPKGCFRFYKLNAIDEIRPLLLRAKAFALNYVLKYPEDACPGIRLRAANGYGYCKGIDNFEVAIQTSSEFQSQIEDILSVTLSEMSHRGIPVELL